MRIVINHLTRMQPGYFCAAGIEIESRLHVRPLYHGHLTVDMLARNGGPFQLGAVLDLGKTRFEGRVPEIEDRGFDREHLQHVEQLHVQELAQLCAEVAGDTLPEVFSDALQPYGRTAAILEHGGQVSLGCLWVPQGELSNVTSDTSRRIRFAFPAWGRELSVPVTDLRLYDDDHQTINETVFAEMQFALENVAPVLVSVGVSRPYRKSDDDAPRHWLQINNIHLASSDMGLLPITLDDNL